MTKTITIFGSTGSIGKSTIDIISRNHRNYQVLGLSAKTNYKLLAQQAIEFNAKCVCIVDEEYYSSLKELLSSYNINVVAGEKGLLELCALKADIVVTAIVGSAGMRSTYNSIINGSNIALANKESLVCAGDIIIDAAKKHNVKIIPTDSEHNAIFQVFEEENRNQISKLTLTASGGPFLNMPTSELKNITPEQATKHPNWSMGKKITVDCSNMVNKGLELIEAHYLFNMPSEKIDILVHPQSIIHSMVSYIDGSSLAQLGNPDMRTPISYALDWPKRPSVKIVEPLHLSEIKRLEFLDCDTKRFPAINLCRETILSKGDSKLALNAANEIAVQYFLDRKIKYTDIIDTIKHMLGNSSTNAPSSIDEAIEIDKKFRLLTEEYINGTFI